MSAIAEVAGLTKTYGKVTAVDDVSFSLEEGKIHGLLGRNGAGKSTVMRLITGQEFATDGSVSVFGANPVENAAVLRRIAIITESQTYPDEFKGKHLFKVAPLFYDHWDAEYADHLIKAFHAPLDRPIKKLSRGQHSALGVVLGLASRAELTFFDEPYAGLDAPSRQLFYDELLADYAAHPRTIVLSTHLIDEAADLLEHVFVIDGGKLVINASADELRGTAVTLAGPAAAVDAFVEGRDVLGRDGLGGLATATVAGLDARERARAADQGLEIGPVSLQQLIVRRTGVYQEA